MNAVFETRLAFIFFYFLFRGTPGLQGPQGPMGIQGPKGDKGEQVAGFKGPISKWIIQNTLFSMSYNFDI